MKELFKQLTEAYSDANLNQISGKLIQLYKSKQHGAIIEITNKIAGYTGVIADEKINKCFSGLIMLYHPDRGESIRSEIGSLFKVGDYDKMKGFSHILLTIDFVNEDHPVEIDGDEYFDIDYEPEYAWDESTDEYGFNTYHAEDLSGDHEPMYGAEEFERSFYNVLKLRIYGNLDMNFPTYYLEDFEEIEMADSDLDYLDGIQFCKQAKIINLSGNRLSDLAILYNMKGIEELYLADNQIVYTEILGKLPNLKSLDLSNNEIEDISPLLQLENLQYINLVGNKVPSRQIDQLKELGVMVVC